MGLVGGFFLVCLWGRWGMAKCGLAAEAGTAKCGVAGILV